MKSYYAVCDEQKDEEVQKILDHYIQPIQQVGGEISLSKGFSITPPVIVLSLPDEIDPTAVCPVFLFLEVIQHAESV